MINLLPNDVSRCYGKDCGQKESCKRFAAIAQDDPLRSYWYVVAFNVPGNPDCIHRIPLEKENA